MKKISKKPLVILAVGVILLAGSSVGATRAAIESASAAIVSFNTAKLQVDLLENGEVITSDKNKSAKLTFPAIKEDGELKIGKKYAEDVSVKNTASTEEYVRVNIRKSWETKVGKGDEDYVKETSLSPDTIEVSVDPGKWIEDKSNSTAEGKVYYLKGKLGPDETVQFCSDITIKDDINSIVSQTFVEKEDESGKTITHKYLYDDKYFYVEIRVDAVQTNNGADAIYGAWGTNVDLAADGSISAIHAEKFE